VYESAEKLTKRLVNKEQWKGVEEVGGIDVARLCRVSRRYAINVMDRGTQRCLLVPPKFSTRRVRTSSLSGNMTTRFHSLLRVLDARDWVWHMLDERFLILSVLLTACSSLPSVLAPQGPLCDTIRKVPPQNFDWVSYIAGVLQSSHRHL
jgi:hypothetical protein